MTTLTITEALAEIQTIGKRIEKKQQSVLAYLARPEQLRDPLEKQGGSVAHITGERQAIADLQERMLRIRRAIAQANEANTITVGDATRSIADWLAWKREVAPQQTKLLAAMRGQIDQTRNTLRAQSTRLAQSGSSEAINVVVNLDERELSRQIEWLEEVSGALDGQLSLKNATIVIEI